MNTRKQIASHVLKMHDDVYYTSRDAMGSSVLAQVNEQMNNQVRSQVRDQIEVQVHSHLSDKFV